MKKSDRILKRTAETLCVVILLVWCVSAFVGFAFIRRTSPYAWAFQIDDGVFSATRLSNSTGIVNQNAGWHAFSPFQPQSFGLVLPAENVGDPNRRGPIQIVVPFWLMLVIVTGPSTFHFWRQRRRGVAGHCASCGYDLTGNTSGACPECGTPIPEQAEAVQQT